MREILINEVTYCKLVALSEAKELDDFTEVIESLLKGKEIKL